MLNGRNFFMVVYMEYSAEAALEIENLITTAVQIEPDQEDELQYKPIHRNYVITTVRL
jgi:hypothetical protein